MAPRPRRLTALILNRRSRTSATSACDGDHLAYAGTHISVLTPHRLFTKRLIDPPAPTAVPFREVTSSNWRMNPALAPAYTSCAVARLSVPSLLCPAADVDVAASTSTA